MPQKTAQIFPQLVAMTTANAPVSGAKATYYLAGTVTKISLYADHLGATPLANPVTADSFGRFVTVFLTPGTLYDLDVTTSAGASLDGYPVTNLRAAAISSQDTAVEGTAGEALTAGQVVYLSDGSGGKTAGLWYLADADFTYASTTPVIGISIDAVAALATGTFLTAGRATGLSGLTVGANYYVSGTAGAMTSTAPANARKIGQADTTTTLVFNANPPVAAGGLQLLGSGSGTSTAAAAANVATIAITGMNALDELVVEWAVQAVTQDVAVPKLYNVTDSLNLGGLRSTGTGFAGDNLVAGVNVVGRHTYRQYQSSGMLVGAIALLTNALFSSNLSFTTAWTGAWTLALRHEGVTAGGTFRYQWAVYRMVGA